jgi:hypothetical protein
MSLAVIYYGRLLPKLVNGRVKYMYRPTGSQPVYPSVWPHSVPKTTFFFCQTVEGLSIWRPLWLENGFVDYNCCWFTSSSFSEPSPAGLMFTFFCLIFETPPHWRARSPYVCRPGPGWPSYTPRYWVPHLSPFTTRRATVEVFEPASTHGLLGKLPPGLSLHILGMNRIGNTAPNSSCIVACVSVAAGTCLSSRRLAPAVSCGSTILAFQPPWHNILLSINALLK